MAVRIDAAGDYLYRTSSAPAQYPLTVTFWVYITTDRNAYGALYLIANAGGTSFVSFNLSSSGTNLQISVGGNTTNGSNLSTGTWYHIACVIASATSQKMYLNGVLDINKTTSSYTFTAAQYFLGSDSVGWLNGREADVKIFERELTANEIKSEMMDINPMTNRAWAVYPLFAGATERLLDYSGNGRNLTAAGTLTDEAGPPVSWGAQTLCGLPIAVSGNTGQANVTLGELTGAATGTISIAGQSSSILGTLTGAATGTLAIAGQAAATLANITQAATGALAIVGQANATLDSLTGAATGALSIAGAANATLENLTGAGTGTLAIAGQASTIFGQLTGAATGALSIVGQGNATLDSLIAAGTGALAIAGQASVTLGQLIGEATGVLTSGNTGQGNVTLGELTGAATGVLSIAGASNVVLGELTATATGALAITGQADVTLGQLTGAGVGDIDDGAQEFEGNGYTPLPLPMRPDDSNEYRAALLTVILMALEDA